MTAYRFFGIKMFKLQHQVKNLAETTQFTNDQMPEFHCHCCHRQLQASSCIITIFGHAV